MDFLRPTVKVFLSFCILSLAVIVTTEEAKNKDVGIRRHEKKSDFESSHQVIQSLTSRDKRDHDFVPSAFPASGLHENASGGWKGFLRHFLPQKTSYGSSNSIVRRHSSSPSATDIANRAAGEATAAAAGQAELAYKAAKQISRKIAAHASSAAQRAQDAAAHKYAQAAKLTQATQFAQALVFKEASQASRTAKTVQAAEAIKNLALSQLGILQQAVAAAEAQAVVSHQVLEAAAAAYMEQIATLKHAQKVTENVIQQQNKAINELASAQAAAEKARAAATKALYKAHPAEPLAGLRKKGVYH